MAFYYDVARTTTTNATANTPTTHLRGNTIANQETVAIKEIDVNAFNFANAGSAGLRIWDNTGTAATGGTTQTARPKNTRAPAAQSVWNNDASAITAGGTLNLRASVGFAQTGGQGGWVAITPDAAWQMLPGAPGSPVDMEFTSIAQASSVPFTFTVHFSEGIG